MDLRCLCLLWFKRYLYISSLHEIALTQRNTNSKNLIIAKCLWGWCKLICSQKIFSSSSLSWNANSVIIPVSDHEPPNSSSLAQCIESSVQYLEIHFPLIFDSIIRGRRFVHKIWSLLISQVRTYVVLISLHETNKFVMLGNCYM